MNLEERDLGPEEFLGIKDATDLVGGAEEVPMAHAPPPPPAGPPPDGRSPGHNGSYEGPLRTGVKILVTNGLAGSIIGKGGTNITDYQQQSGAKIALSRAHEVFPGTNDRVLAVTGELEKVVFAVRTIYSNRRPGPEDEDIDEDMDGVSLRLVLPRQVCGAVIGKSGATIREIVETTNASLKMSPQETAIMGLTDRILTISGDLPCVLAAMESVLENIGDSAVYAKFCEIIFPYRSILESHPSEHLGSGDENGLNGNQISDSLDESGLQVDTTLTLAVSDAHMGHVVGKNGRTLGDIQRVADVVISLSPKGDYLPGTQNRKVTITGSPDGVQAARHLIAHKIIQATRRN